MDAAAAGWLRLLRADGISGKTLSALAERFGGADEILLASDAALTQAGCNAGQKRAIRGARDLDLSQDLEWLAQPGCGLMGWNDAAYPRRLRDIAHPPPVLFWRGDISLLQAPYLAIVGARNATPQGLENARAFSAELAANGLGIVSGLALGIDGAAHAGALDADGITTAVCATGLDRVYPRQHHALATRIAETGLLISEFLPGTAPRPQHFPRRNRLIAGLSLGVLVVEAARESGSLITARLAGEQGREVFAIPGSIHNVMSRGCHALIRQGAKLVETAQDIVEEIGPLLPQQWSAPARGEQDAETAVAQDDADVRALMAALGKTRKPWIGWWSV